MNCNKLPLTILMPLLLCVQLTMAQKSVTLNTSQNSGTTYDYQARDFILMEPGFTMTPASNANLLARINEKMNTETGNISANPSAILDRSSLNTGYEVGSTAGTASVAAGGQAVYTIPIFASPGTGGMIPNISLQYMSQQEMGVAGYGWDISGLSSISRTNPTLYHNGQSDGITFTNADAFVMDGQRLLPITGSNGANGTIYGTESESFTQIISYGTLGNGPQWFEVKFKSGITMQYGNTADSRLENGSTVCTWKVNKITDANGNYMLFSYVKETGESVIDQIAYTGNTAQGLQPYNSIEFYYDRRTDVSTKYVAGKTLTNSFLLRKINAINEGATVRTYTLTYQYDLYTKLIEVVESAGSLRYNSTLIRWEGLIANLMPSPVLYNNYMPTLTKGDANGDGVTDLVVYDGLNSKIKLILSSGLSFTEYDVCNYTYHPTFIPAATMLNVDGGDQKDEIYVRFFNSNISFVRYLFNGSSVVPVPGTNIITNTVYSSHFSGDFRDLTVIPLELNGDDQLEFAFLRTTANKESYLEKIESTNSINFTNLLPSATKTFIAGQRLSFIDFNGNGRTEILTINNQTSPKNTLYEFNINNTFTTRWTGNLILFDDREMWGDFNGDGKTDLFLLTKFGTAFYPLSVYLSNGIDQFNLQPNLVNAINTKMSSNPQASTISVNDFNADGKSDILYHNSASDNNKLEFFYSNGKDYNLTTNVTQSNIFEVKNWVFTDLNGDGICDAYGTLSSNGLITGAVHNIMRINYNASFFGGNVITEITNGLDLKTYFAYSRLTEGRLLTTFISNPYVYMGSNYGIANVPQIVVKKLHTGNAAGTAFYEGTRYQYISPTYHKGGKGLLGFIQVIRFKEFNNIHLYTEMDQFALNTTYHAMYPSASHTYQPNSIYIPLTDKISSRNYNFTFQSQGGLRFWLKPTSEINVDVLNNITETITYNTYDNFGNPTKTTSVKGVQTTVVDNTYVQAGAFCPNKVSTNTITMTRSGQPTIIRAIHYTYHATTGNLVSTITDPGKAKSVTTTNYYTGNSCGLVSSKTTSANGLANRTESYEYDTKFRFVTKIFNTLNQPKTTTYDPQYGNVLTETGVDGLINKFTYNSFGRLVKSINPQNIETQLILGWSPSPNSGNLYYTYSNTGGMHGITSWYDVIGRLVKKNYIDANNNLLGVNYTFYPNGRPKSETKPYFSNQTPVDATVNNYDIFGRVISSTNLGRETTFTYDNTTRSVVKKTKNGAGVVLTTHTSVMDNSGVLESASDDAGTINYAYNSAGQPLATNALGITTSFTYDEYGNKTSLTDPSSGTTLYIYNSFGELINETDAKGVSKTLQYDVAGRVSQIVETPGNKTTTYTYISSGNGINQISSIVTDHGINQTLEYDAYGRRIKITEIIDGQNFVTDFTYNNLDQLTSTTYPSGYKVDHTYNGNGYQTGSLANNQSIWSNGTFNEMGQPLSVNLRNGYTFQYTYDNFYQPVYRSVHNTVNAIIRRQETSFDAYTGNLTFRKDITRNLTENFTYDVMERLKTANSGATLSTNYESNGNIRNKSDVSTADYIYGNTPYAVTDIPSPFVTIPSLTQNISYNNNDMATLITEGTSSLALFYGHDHERRKTVLLQNGQTIQTRYYAGNYEKEVTPTGTKEFHYLQGNAGLVAVMIRQNGQDNLYYTYTDHLGSIIGLMDVNGNMVEEYSFDAWGRRRNPSNWTYANVPSPTLINRGYTGHEHLDQFGTINMNARLYDAVLGRMMGPDAFVQAPDNTQSYNRYSYAWNNPLKYTDPDGNFVLEAIIIGAMIGGMINATSQSLNGNVKNSGDFWMAFGIGALAGGLGAGVGAGVNVAIAGGSFGAGFLGTTTVSSTGFIAGAASGASAGLTNGFILGTGNSLVAGQNISEALNNGLSSAWKQGLIGGLTGGVIGGVDATSKGRDFWTGSYKQYSLEPTILASTDNSFSDSYTFPSDATVANADNYKVYYKTEDGVTGIKDYVSPGNYIKKPVDGIATSKFKLHVFKIPDGGRVVVGVGGNVEFTNGYGFYDGLALLNKGGWQNSQYFISRGAYPQWMSLFNAASKWIR